MVAAMVAMKADKSAGNWVDKTVDWLVGSWGKSMVV